MNSEPGILDIFLWRKQLRRHHRAQTDERKRGQINVLVEQLEEFDKGAGKAAAPTKDHRRSDRPDAFGAMVMTTWRNAEIPVDVETRRPLWDGAVELYNDKNELLGSVMWFYEGGPYYAHAVDLKEPKIIRRIGPCDTLEGGKRQVLRVIEGELDVSNRAGYPR